MASLKDIAEKLGVSVALVSKVLSGRMGTSGCSANTRKAILAKAKELQFRPNPLAVALRAGRKGTVGVFLHRIGNPGSGLAEALLDGIAEVCNEHRERLWLSFFYTDQEFVERSPAAARHEVDGLIVAGIAHPELAPVLREVHRAGVPVLTVYSRPFLSSIPNVFADEEAQGYLATKHLLQRGCRRVAHVGNIERKVQGYRRALSEQGVPFSAELLKRSSGFRLPEGEAAARAWLDGGTKFDGVVAQSDEQALGVLFELQRRGVRVPEDVKVIGVDDAPLCDLSPVPLSSVSQEMAEVGRCAARTLLAGISGKRMRSSVVLPRLVRRASA